MAMPEHKQGIDGWQTSRANMSEVELNNWLELLEQRTGICLPRERQSFLLSNLEQRMRELELGSYEAYYQYLTTGVQGELEWELLVDRLTVHETRFMRDAHALSLVSQLCLPSFQASSDKDGLFRVWSVGCATGEEPYSLAMVIDNYLQQDVPQFDYQILATDISLSSLITAQWGVYLHNRGKNMQKEFRERYTQQHDDAHFKVNKPIRNKVKFSQFNLLSLEKATIPLMDVIICQNVLIYFKQEQRRKMLDEIIRFIKPGGILILGAGEVINWKNPLVKSLDYPSTMAFQRLDDPSQNRAEAK